MNDQLACQRQIIVQVERGSGDVDVKVFLGLLHLPVVQLKSLPIGVKIGLDHGASRDVQAIYPVEGVSQLRKREEGAGAVRS